MRYITIGFDGFGVGRQGFEPWTRGLKVVRRMRRYPPSDSTTLRNASGLG